jgi:hypothetical protein
MSNQELFLGYIKAYNEKDVAGMLQFFDESCIFENISAGKVTVRTTGKLELEALARRSVESSLSREQKILSLTEGPGRIAAEIDYHAVLRAERSPGSKAGSHLAVRGISVCEFSGAKIVRLTDYS